MHENANRHFVGELRLEEAPDTFKRVVLHGRVFSVLDDAWHMVVTEILPGGELAGIYGDGFHGVTRLVREGEYLTWGTEPVKVDKLPVVNHEGVRITYPGWITTAQLSERGKLHALRFRFAEFDLYIGCNRATKPTGGVGARGFLEAPNVCKDCHRAVLAMMPAKGD